MKAIELKSSLSLLIHLLFFFSIFNFHSFFESCQCEPFVFFSSLSAVTELEKLHKGTLVGFDDEMEGEHEIEILTDSISEVTRSFLLPFYK